MDRFRPKDDDDTVLEFRRGVEDFRNSFSGFLRGRGSWMIILAAVLVYLASGIYIVRAGEKAVVLLFGKKYEITEPGLRYRLPWPFMTKTIVDVSTVRRVEIGFRSDGSGRNTRPFPAESLMLTGDENIVDVQLFVQYRVNDPYLFLYGGEAPEQTLRASAEVALRGIVGENPVDYTMTLGKSEIQTKVQKYLEKLLDAYNTGLQVTQASLLAVNPPPAKEVQEAFHDVVRAMEDGDRLLKESEGFVEEVLPKARGMAQQDIREAEAYKAQRVTKAQGDAKRFDITRSEYEKAPAVTRQRLYLESAETFLSGAKKYIMEPTATGIMPFLPLGTDQKYAPPPPKEDKRGGDR